MRVWLLSSTSCFGANDESHPQLVVFPLGLVPAGANSCQEIRGGPSPIHALSLLIYLWVRDQLNIKVLST
jgi:hypothetical protein